MKPFDRDPPVRRLALVRWDESASLWKLEIAARVIDGQHLRATLEGRGRQRPTPWRILDVVGRRGSIEEAVAAMTPPTADAPGLYRCPEHGDFRGFGLNPSWCPTCRALCAPSKPAQLTLFDQERG